MRRTKSEALETRSALLDAAECVFYEKGVSQTTLTDIAKAAGMTRGAIYWHFSDKAALFDAMQERGRLPQDFFKPVGGEDTGCDPLGTLQRTGVEALEYLAANKRSQRVCAIMLLRCEFVGEMAEVLGRMRAADETMKNAIRMAFEAAAARGHMAPNWQPQAATSAYSCAMTGLIVEWFRSEQAFDIVAAGHSVLNALFSDIAAADAGDRPQRGRSTLRTAASPPIRR